MSYSQNKEDLFVLRYFGNFKGTLLSIGENDGQTFSNANLLIQHGWGAVLCEPGETFNDLDELHKNRARVTSYNYAIGDTTGKVKFWESGAHVRGGSDTGLVSTTDPAETERWRKAGVKFTEKEIYMLKWDAFYDSLERPVFEYITIDAEGADWAILQQINLTEVGCRCLVIEWNGDYDLYSKFVDYCGKDGLVLRVQNNENLIFVKGKI
jgi:hypothetical protein